MLRRTCFSLTCNGGKILYQNRHISSNENIKKAFKSKRIRAISCDVTGTLVSFLGRIEDHYGDAARTCGVEISQETKLLIPQSFNKAYKETSVSHPCFGNSCISSKEWWRRCVKRSFELVGTSMNEQEEERVFQRVYSTFGSHAAYGVFDDATPFLKWCKRHGITCGVLSNADERYGDSILPMLGLSDHMQFFTFSKNVGVEKPGKDIFDTAIQDAQPWLCLGNNRIRSDVQLLPEEVLHIGNDYQKDYVGATNAGFRSVLLDRYDEKEVAEGWRKGGALVFKDLIDVAEWLGREQYELGPRDECEIGT
mmetsp:Transcript_20245/g.31634  ORF Transcript_20245/g.31634 Transcript_20245/m.31634 type:complete len:309 (+) Transcript_20245:161-1087(+)